MVQTRRKLDPVVAWLVLWAVLTTGGSAWGSPRPVCQPPEEPPETTNETEGEPEIIGFISVRDFGAVGNGVTDDTPCIEAALDHLDDDREEVGALGTVYFPPGRYVITSTIQLPVAATKSGSMGIRLLGSGYDAAILNRNPSPTQPAIRAGSRREGQEKASTFEMGHLVIIGNPAHNHIAAPGAHGIETIKAQFAYIHDLWILAAGNAINGRGLIAGRVERVEVWPTKAQALYADNIPDPAVAGVGFNFRSSGEIPDPVVTTMFRDCDVYAGSDAFVFSREANSQGGSGTIVNVGVSGSVIENISGHAFRLRGLGTEPLRYVNNVRISAVRATGLEAECVNGEVVDRLTLEDVTADAGIRLSEVSRASFQNIQMGGVLELVNPEDLHFTALNASFSGGLHPENAFDFVPSWLIAGVPIGSFQGMHP